MINPPSPDPDFTDLRIQLGEICCTCLAEFTHSTGEPTFCVDCNALASAQRDTVLHRSVIRCDVCGHLHVEQGPASEFTLGRKVGVCENHMGTFTPSVDPTDHKVCFGGFYQFGVVRVMGCKRFVSYPVTELEEEV